MAESFRDLTQESAESAHSAEKHETLVTFDELKHIIASELKEGARLEVEKGTEGLRVHIELDLEVNGDTELITISAVIASDGNGISLSYLDINAPDDIKPRIHEDFNTFIPKLIGHLENEHGNQVSGMNLTEEGLVVNFENSEALGRQEGGDLVLHESEETALVRQERGTEALVGQRPEIVDSAAPDSVDSAEDNRKLVTFLELRKFIASLLKEGSKLEFEVTSDGIQLHIELDESEGHVVIEGTIVEEDNDLKVKQIEVQGPESLKQLMESSFHQLIPELKHRIAEERGNAVAHMHFDEKGLVVEFQEGLVRVGDQRMSVFKRETGALVSQRERDEEEKEETALVKQERGALVLHEDEETALVRQERGTEALVRQDKGAGAMAGKEKNGGENMKERKTRKRRVGIVDTSDALEDQARDMADARMTAEKGELRGVSGFVKKMWRYNLAYEYYRQKEIALAREQISSSGNLYAGEGADLTAHNTAMNAVVDRFISQYEDTDVVHAREEREVIGAESREEDRQLNEDIRLLIRQFASGAIDEDNFRVERDRIIAVATRLEGAELRNTVNHTDNLFEVARQARMAVDNGIALDDVDEEIELVIGKARLGVRTEAKYNVVDRIAERINASGAGRFVNETTVSLAVAAAYSVTVGLSQRIARSSVATYWSLGGTAVFGGILAASREGARVSEERRQHSREMAKGKEIGPDSPRRTEMERTRYETVPAKFLCDDIRNRTETIETPEQFLNAVGAVAEADARVKLSDTEDIDLIAYSDFKAIEKERFYLDVARAEAKVKLRDSISGGTITVPGGVSFDDFLKSATQTQVDTLRGGDEGMEARDKIFRKMKAKKVAAATIKALTVGLVVGVAVQENVAYWSSNQDSVFEHSRGRGNSVTLLHSWFREEAVASRVMHHTTLPDGSEVMIPDGVDITPNPTNPGQYILTKDGQIFSDKIVFSAGKLTQASEEILRENGIRTTPNPLKMTRHATTARSPKDVVNNHAGLFKRIHRKFWYDNDTKVFDRNELKLHWGGVKGTGIAANGHYVFNAGKMTPGGSFHSGASVDAQDAMKHGDLKMLLSLSKDTQFTPVEVYMDASGNVDIDPNSDVGKMFFKVDAKGQLKFIGKFAEVARSVKPGADGLDTFEILATAVGPGAESVTDSTNTVVDTTLTSFDVIDKPEVLLPPVIPLGWRTPLEPIHKKKPEGKGGKKPDSDKDEKNQKSDPVGEKILDKGQKDKSKIKENKKQEKGREKSSDDDEKAEELDDAEKTRAYLEGQDPKYLADLHTLVAEAPPLSNEVETVIAVPAFQDGAKMERSIRDYANIKEVKNSGEKFELVIMEYHQKDTERDDTAEVIQKMQKEFPKINIVHLYKVFDKPQTPENIEKLMVDSVLVRKDKVKRKKPLTIRATKPKPMGNGEKPAQKSEKEPIETEVGAESTENRSFSIDILRDVLTAEVGSAAIVSSSDIETKIEKGRIIVDAQLSGGLVYGQIKIKCSIENEGDGVVAKNIDIQARGYVKRRYEKKLADINAVLKESIKKKTGESVLGIQIDDKGLMVKFDKTDTSADIDSFKHAA